MPIMPVKPERPTSIGFYVKLDSYPTDNDLTHLKATRALLTMVTGVEAKGQSSTLLGAGSSNREFCCGVHIDHLTPQMLGDADALVRLGLIARFEWHGTLRSDTEEEKKATPKPSPDEERLTSFLRKSLDAGMVHVADAGYQYALTLVNQHNPAGSDLNAFEMDLAVELLERAMKAALKQSGQERIDNFMSQAQKYLRNFSYEVTIDRQRKDG